MWTTSCFWRREGTHHPHLVDPAYFAPRLRTYFRKVASQLLARSTHPARAPLFGSCVEAKTGFLATRSFHDPPTHPPIGPSGRARTCAKCTFFVWRSVDTTARARTTLFSLIGPPKMILNFLVTTFRALGVVPPACYTLQHYGWEARFLNFEFLYFCKTF